VQFSVRLIIREFVGNRYWIYGFWTFPATAKST